MKHNAIWTSPDPVRSKDNTPGNAPVLLRFANDNFMDSLQTTLRDAPERLSEWTARFETWRDGIPDPSPSTPTSPLARRMGLRARPAAEVSPPTPTRLPKLYQPAHQRHYLVAAQLVCETPGFPDRVIDRGQQEQAGYVLRRLLPSRGKESTSAETWDEYAFVANAWRKAEGEKLLADGEELLPLFPLNYRNGERPRRLLAGLIPVGRREAFMGAPTQSGDELPENGTDARLAAFDADIVGPWLNLLDRVGDFNAGSITASNAFPDMDQDADKTTAEIVRARRALRNQIQSGSWYVLLDLLAWLEKHLNPVWRVVTGQAAASTLSATPALAAVWTALNAVTQPGGSIGGKTLTQTLQDGMPPPKPPLLATLVGGLQVTAGSLPYTAAKAQSFANALERVTVAYSHSAPAADWPDFLFPFADPQFSPPLDVAGVNALREKIAAALPALSGTTSRASIPNAPIGDASNLAWFLIRCVFRRPDCEPLHPAVLSAPSQAFEMAGFFDPDAPARPVRIGLPIDPTPAGLRRFDKKTFMVMSDLLCGQVSRFRKVTFGDLILSVLPWPLHKDLPVGESVCAKGAPGIGMVCSLSIPIITICALILLMIIVSLLDFVFRWMPWFFMCLPIPGLKGKK